MNTFISRYYATVPPIQRWTAFGIGAAAGTAIVLVAAKVTGWDPGLLIPISVVLMLLIGAGVVGVFRVTNRRKSLP